MATTRKKQHDGPGRPIDWQKRHDAVVKELDELKKSIELAEAEIMVAADGDSLDFLLGVMRCPKLPLDKRMRAAITAAQYQHTKKGKKGKKEEASDHARGVSESGSSRLRPSTAPQLKKVA